MNYTNNDYDVITDKRSIPYSSAGTGTISTLGTGVVGAGTAFRSEAPAGSWFVDLSQNELRKVKTVESDTVIYLEQAFSSDIAALTTPQIIHQKLTNVFEISVIIPLVDASGTANAFGKINNKTFPSGLPYELSKAGRDENSQRDFIDPIIVDATSTTMLVSTLE